MIDIYIYIDIDIDIYVLRKLRRYIAEDTFYTLNIKREREKEKERERKRKKEKEKERDPVFNALLTAPSVNQIWVRSHS